MSAARASRWRVLVVAAALLTCAGCERFPNDPEGTLDRVTGGVLRVGVSEDPPYVRRDVAGHPSGVDVELLRSYAASRGARLQLVVDGHADLMAALEAFDLDVVAGGIDEDSPWAEHVALSRPYAVRGADGRHARRVLALPPGENALAMDLDRFVHGPRGAAVRGMPPAPR